jgi:hypothetical protein
MYESERKKKRKREMRMKEKNTSRIIVAAGLACVMSTFAYGGGGPVANLELNALNDTVGIGDTIQVELIVRAGQLEDVEVPGAQTIINWDPSILRLTGFVANEAPGDYEWLLDDFTNDCGLDGLNDPCAFGLPPANDGDAFFEALAQFPPPLGMGSPIVGIGGLKITTLLFEALAATPVGSPSPISIPFESGVFTTTAVFGPVPGVSILGETSGTEVTVVPEPTTAVFLIALSVGFVRTRRRGIR